MNLYEKLKYRVDLITEDEIPEQVTRILNITPFKVFYAKKSRHKQYKLNVIKYIGLMYDHKSPFTVEYLDLEKRKQAVAKHCDFTEHGQRGNKYREEYQQFIDVDTEEAKILILSF